MQDFQSEKDGLKGFLVDKGVPKNQHHWIILALDLRALKFIGILVP